MAASGAAFCGRRFAAAKARVQAEAAREKAAVVSLVLRWRDSVKFTGLALPIRIYNRTFVDGSWRKVQVFLFMVRSASAQRKKGA
jgi:hypothetical protein